MPDNSISFYRGDTARLHFHREDQDGGVIMERAQHIFFTVKKKGFEEKAGFVLQKKDNDFSFDENGEYHFTINATDTDKMESSQQYTYDIEVINNGVKTTIASGALYLKTEVTTTADEGGE